MQRYEILREILQQGECFKLVCGAGNENDEDVKRLSLIYSIAGVTILDISARPEIVKAAKEGIELSYHFALLLNRKINVTPYINVSIGIKGDPHIRKANINPELCIGCGNCFEKCNREAINGTIVDKKKCIGCGECAKNCPSDAIYFSNLEIDFSKILPQCIIEGVEIMELHAATEFTFIKDWKLLNKLIPNNFLSLCIDRNSFSNEKLIERIEEAYQITKERLIVQADGIPMSGSEDDFNTTLQAIACADIVRKSKIPAMIMLSGGTNSKTGELSRICEVKANGIALGTYARKMINEHLHNDNFYSDLKNIESAVVKAERLINSNLEAMKW